MLKYIGDFEKLKDYGFEDLIDKPINSFVYQGELYEEYICIGEEGNICIVTEDDVWKLDKLYDLIKDGLVIKEEE